MFLNAFNLKDKIQYKEHHFDSKIILEDGDRKIMLLALKKTQELPEHFSPVNAALYVLCGEIVFKTEKEDYKIEAENMFILPANEKHKVLALKDSKFIVIRL